MSGSLYPNLDALPTTGGVLVVGHGTRSAAGQRQLLDLAAAMQGIAGSCVFEPAFLELAEPDIAAGLARLRDRGVSRVLIVPVLLFSAAHDLEDIPSAVEQAAGRLSLQIIGQSRPLGEQAAALALSQLRCLQSLLCTEPAGCDRAGGCPIAETCCGPWLSTRADVWFDHLLAAFDAASAAGRTSARGGECDLDALAERLRGAALVMVGRGTSQLPARRAMERFMQERLRRFPAAWSTIGFFAGDDRTVERALDQAADQTASDTVIVQPHLLFEGLLSQQLRQAVDSRRGSGKRWLVASPLGADRSLAHAWLRMADGCLASGSSSLRS